MRDIDKLKEAINTLTKFADHITVCEPIAPQLLTPPGIKFLVEKSGKVTGMYFNEGKQCLQFCELTGQFEVRSVYESDSRVVLWPMSESLPLTPCKYEDLKPGDFSFSICDECSIEEQSQELHYYSLHLPDKDGVRQSVIINFEKIETVSEETFHYWKVGS